MTERTIWQVALSREQWIVAAVLALAIGLAWALLVSMGIPSTETSMPSMAGMQDPPWSATWTLSYAAMVLAMWAIMMIAMMLPSATPMILLYARVAGQPNARSTLAPTSLFAGTYLVLWTLFALVATVAQWTLAQFQLLSNATMAVGNGRVGGALLIAAGLYQLTPLKRICLENCRSPISFLTAHWRPSLIGAINLGVRHGAYCIGCCWLLMALLFFGGVTNLIWVTAIAAVVLVEKVAPAGQRIGQSAGALAILAGAALILAPSLS
jgi:predicted metal-binding membrane protein